MSSVPSSSSPSISHSVPENILKTPEWLSSLSKEVEDEVSKKNILTNRSRRKLLSDLRESNLEEENVFISRLRAKAIQELKSSEEAYLSQLEVITKEFATPILEKKLLPTPVYESIFGEIPSILRVNQTLLEGLKETSEDEIGALFLRLSPFMKFYSSYTNEFEEMTRKVEKWTKKSKDFRSFLTETENVNKCTLNSLLITPVQRIPRYKLLLEDVFKNTPKNHRDKENLSLALNQMHAIALHINDHITLHENSVKLIDIQKSLLGNCPKIIEPGRKLIKQGTLMKVPRNGGGSGVPRYFVLFSDMLMYCKIKGVGALPRKNALEVCCTFPLKHSVLEDVVGKGVFKIICRKDELLLYSNNENEKTQEWMTAIQDAISKLLKDASTLRKDSSRRQPLRRPELLKLRRESLSAINLMRRNSKETQEERGISLRKRKPSFSSLISNSPSKQRKVSTPNLKYKKSLRSWKTLSLIKKDKFPEEESTFQSPSIYRHEDLFTPSRKPTNVSHLAGGPDEMPEPENTSWSQLSQYNPFTNCNIM